jgi:hypothetical protein
VLLVDDVPPDVEPLEDEEPPDEDELEEEVLEESDDELVERLSVR